MRYLGYAGPDVKAEHLTRWREPLHAAEIITLPQAGHFVQEEADDLAAIVASFLDGQSHPTGTART